MATAAAAQDTAVARSRGETARGEAPRFGKEKGATLGRVSVAALAIAAAGLQGLPGAAAASLDAGATGRQERFLELLRRYPQRPPRETVAQVEHLVDAGEFADRARAEYW